MRLVLDTNTAVSGLIWGGVPGRLIDAAAAGKTQIISSVPLLDELHDVLFRKKFAAQLAEQAVDAADLFEGYAALVQLVGPAVIGPVILADPDDDIVLATAVACGAGLIVSGDAHLLGIGEFQGIFRPHAFGGCESVGGVTGGSPPARWHLRLSGTTTSFGVALPASPSGCSLQAAGHEVPAVSLDLPRSSTAKTGTALIVNRATICGFSYPSTCCFWMTTSPTRALRT